MTAEDVPAATDLLNRIIDLGGTTAHQQRLDEATFASYHLGAAQIACHVVLDPDDKLAGFQWLGANPHLPSDCGDIASFTRRDAPLRGAGRTLFAATCVAARATGLTQINATIRADNASGLGYYTAMGFVDHSVERAVPLADGTPVDRISKRFTL